MLPFCFFGKLGVAAKKNMQAARRTITTRSVDVVLRCCHPNAPNAHAETPPPRLGPRADTRQRHNRSQSSNPTPAHSISFHSYLSTILLSLSIFRIFTPTQSLTMATMTPSTRDDIENFKRLVQHAPFGAGLALNIAPYATDPIPPLNLRGGRNAEGWRAVYEGVVQPGES